MNTRTQNTKAKKDAIANQREGKATNGEIKAFLEYRASAEYRKLVKELQAKA